jgi:thiosulfate/3-mercaptopyruvate sulfurtransferase
MKYKNAFVCGLLFTLTVFSFNFPAYAQEPWTVKQLMQPADLANLINSSSPDKPVIFSVGEAAVIKGSVDIGPVREQANLEKFRMALEKLPRSSNIVIYCGCCPFVHCPNVRPAFMLLNEMKFTNQKLLNLNTNIKTDWINKGYPVQSY